MSVGCCTKITVPVVFGGISLIALTRIVLKSLIITTFLYKDLVITISLNIFAHKNSYYGDSI